MSEVRVVDLKELGVNKEVFDKIYSMGEQDGRADAIDELLSKLKPCVFCHDSTDCDIDYFFENCANEDCISWNELKLQAEQLKEQKNEQR